MAKSKRNIINKENMFKKIMPTAYTDNEEVVDEIVDDTVTEPTGVPSDVSLLPGLPPAEDKKEVDTPEEIEEKDKQVVHNLTESLVANRVDALLKRAGNFCRCDKCRMDIILKSIEQLEPQYIYGTEEEIKKSVDEALTKDNMGISSAVMKAFLYVRQNPSH